MPWCYRFTHVSPFYEASFGPERPPVVIHSHVSCMVESSGSVYPRWEDTLLPRQQRATVLELDELWSFVEKKSQECWLWIALCRRTRQIVAYTIGDRSQEGALSLREHVPPDYRRRATRSDFWLAYEKAFPRRTHRFCGKAKGQTNHAKRCFGTLRA